MRELRSREGADLLTDIKLVNNKAGDGGRGRRAREGHLKQRWTLEGSLPSSWNWAVWSVLSFVGPPWGRLGLHGALTPLCLPTPARVTFTVTSFHSVSFSGKMSEQHGCTYSCIRFGGLFALLSKTKHLFDIRIPIPTDRPFSLIEGQKAMERQLETEVCSFQGVLLCRTSPQEFCLHCEGVDVRECPLCRFWVNLDISVSPLRPPPESLKHSSSYCALSALLLKLWELTLPKITLVGTWWLAGKLQLAFHGEKKAQRGFVFFF